jgi:hypothetical protein
MPSRGLRASALTASATLAVLCLCVALWAHGGSPKRPLVGGTARPSSRPPGHLVGGDSAAAPPPRGTVPRRPAVSQDLAVRDLNRVLARAHGRVALAAVDLTSGATVVRGGIRQKFVTASLAKVDILTALLLEHQDRRTRPGPAERALAAEMIESSDNAAADALYRGREDPSA